LRVFGESEEMATTPEDVGGCPGEEAPDDDLDVSVENTLVPELDIVERVPG
jgi:hypothetical protein